MDQNGSLLAKYAQGQNIDEPLAESVGGATYDYEQDGLGSVTSLTNTSGTVAQSYTFDSFGDTTNSSGSIANPFRYTGRDFDSETGLYYYRARYYDPTSGRFLVEDPVMYKGGIDFYRYAVNSPTNFNDPFGFDPNGCKDCKGKPMQGVSVGKSCCGDAAPMLNNAPDPYPSTYVYRGISAQFMFLNGGNGAWGNIVRGCLVCMYSHGVSGAVAHDFCYSEASSRTSDWQSFQGYVAAYSAAGEYAVGASAPTLGSPIILGPK